MWVRGIKDYVRKKYGKSDNYNDKRRTQSVKLDLKFLSFCVNDCKSIRKRKGSAMERSVELDTARRAKEDELLGFCAYSSCLY